jgi:hypothetical protein
MKIKMLYTRNEEAGINPPERIYKKTHLSSHCVISLQIIIRSVCVMNNIVA